MYLPTNYTCYNIRNVIMALYSYNKHIAFKFRNLWYYILLPYICNEIDWESQRKLQ